MTGNVPWPIKDLPKSWLGKGDEILDAIKCVAERYARGEPVALIARECGMSIGQVSRIGHRIVGSRRYIERREGKDRRTPPPPVEVIVAVNSWMCPVCDGRSPTPVHPDCERRQPTTDRRAK